MFKLLFPIIAATTLFISSDVWAIAWAKGKNNAFLSTEFSYYKAKRYWDIDGNSLQQMNPFYKRELNIFCEYGVTNTSNLTFQTYIDSVSQGSASNFGITDLEFALNTELFRYGLENHVISLSNLLIVPTAYTLNTALPLGYGTPAFQWGILSGHKILGGFVELNAFYRHYWGYPCDQLRGEFSGLMPLYKQLSFTWELKIEYGLKDKPTTYTTQDIELEAQYRLFKGAFGFNWKFTEDLSFNLGFNKDLWGRNTGDGYELYTSLWFKF